MDLFNNEPENLKKEVKKRKKIYYFFILAIVLLSVVFAAISVTLRINGTGKAEGRYSIHFENYNSNGVLVINNGSLKGVAPVINFDKTELNNFEINFNEPGDSVEFKFRIVNDGNINGEIENIIFYDGSMNQISKEMEIIKSKITKKLRYENGNPLSIGDVIETGDNQIVTLTYYFDKDKELESLNLSEPLILNDLSVRIIYKQSPKTATTEKGL